MNDSSCLWPPCVLRVFVIGRVSGASERTVCLTPLAVLYRLITMCGRGLTSIPAVWPAARVKGALPETRRDAAGTVAHTVSAA